VNVTVEVPPLKAEDAPEVSHEPVSVIDPVVRESEFADPSFIVTPARFKDAVVPTSEPPPPMTRFAPPVRLFPAAMKVPRIESVPLTSVALAAVTLPEIVRLLKPFEASRVRTVLVAPDNAIVLDPFANVEPAPDVSQLPETVQVPLVNVSTPDPPAIMVTSTTDTVEAFAVRIPEFPRRRDPPVSARLVVASAVVEPAAS
jgi:hypothetical protein